MSWFVRPARESDIEAYHAFALMTGGGFTNLPQNREALAERLAWSVRSFAADVTEPDNELYLLFLEEAGTGRIGGTAAIFSRVGASFPFYSYKLGRVSQSSRELERTFTSEVLHLVNDYDGASEVGGLFLHPEVRGGGVGRLLARSRYLFMAQHRQRFGKRVLAELRGWLRPDGGSPFWDGLGAKFFGMPFQEADRFNGIHGNQFIADLMPKHPIYVSMLPDESRAVIGRPHDSGKPALSMLEEEGFAFDGYIDIFDGGPTVAAQTDHVRSVRESRAGRISELVDVAGLSRALLAAGELMDFRAWPGHAEWAGGELILSRSEVNLHGLKLGDIVRHVV